MIDVNKRAISLTKDNLILSNVKADVFVSNVSDNVNKKYNCITMFRNELYLSCYQ